MSSLRRAPLAQMVGLLGSLIAPGMASLLLAPFVISRYGATAAGAVFVLEALGYYGRIACGGYLATHATGYIARHDDRMVYRTWATGAALAVTLTAAVLLVGAMLDIPPLFAAAVLAVGSGVINPAWVLRGTRRYGAYAAAVNAHAVLRVAIAVYGLTAADELTWYFLSLVIADTMTLLFVLAVLRPLRSARPSVSVLREGLAVLPGSLATQAYTSVDVILLSFLLGNAAAGIYGALYKVQYVGLAVYTVVAQFLMPRPDLYRNPEPRSHRVRWLLAGGACLWPFAVALPFLLFPTALPAVYVDNLSVVVILSLQMSIAFVILPKVLRLLSERPSAYSWTTIAGLTGNVVLVLLLVPVLHLAGAAWASVAAEACVALVAGCFVSQMSKASDPAMESA